MKFMQKKMRASTYPVIFFVPFFFKRKEKKHIAAISSAGQGRVFLFIYFDVRPSSVLFVFFMEMIFVPRHQSYSFCSSRYDLFFF